jgi:hypothetical protein
MSGWAGLWYFLGGFLIIPLIVWFVKVQGALNCYWEGKGATAFGQTDMQGCTSRRRAGATLGLQN